MTNAELNQYIRHYIDQDYTKSAIMLTGGWGTGKSHYINNELIPFLASKDGGNHACIAISLYGLESISDVSKSLYMETRAKWLQNGSEKTITGVIAAKTLLKGVAGLFNFSLNPSKEDLDSLYSSVDLSGKLVIIEDVERVQFGITALLGYVNSLVEQDGVKVLLVANEDEIIRFEPLAVTAPEKKATAELIDRITDHKERTYTQETEAYLSSKEKTISDTLLFEGDLYSAIRAIIGEYHNDTLNGFTGDEDVKEIESIMKAHGDYNLRSFLFACQKTYDIFQKLPAEKEYDTDFLRTIFMGVIGFSIKMKSGEMYKWEGNNQLSFDLGNGKYPLLRFCYDYILFQAFDCSQALAAQDALRELRLYDQNKSRNDPDLIVLNSWHLRTDKEVQAAVERITERLKRPEDISFFEYGELAARLVAVSHIIGCDITTAKQLLVKNLHNLGGKIQADYLFNPLFRDDDQDVNNEYSNLKDRMTESLCAAKETILDFSYVPDDIKSFYSQVIEKRSQILSGGAFASRLDTDRTIEMLKRCSSAQLHDFRGSFLTVYRPDNIGQFLHGDRNAIEALLNQVKELSEYTEFDNIQKFQTQFFARNLEEFLAKL